MLVAACLERMLPALPGAALHILEFADNMCHDAGCLREQSDAIASIIATLRRRDPASALLLLAPFPQGCVRLLSESAGPPFVAGPQVRRGCDVCLRPRFSLASRLEELGRREGVPCASVRQALAVPLRDACQRRDNGTSIGPWLDSFMADSVHPNQEGHAMLASLAADDILKGAVMGTGTGAGVASSRCATARRAPSLRDGAFERETHAVCAFNDELTRHVQSSDGWRYVDERSAANASKPGLVATEPGAALEVCFSPPAAAVARGERFEWQLAYLQSHAGGMGTARGGCVRGCECAAVEWDGHLASSRKISQPALGKLLVHVTKRRAHAPDDHRASDACPCVVLLSVTNRTRSGPTQIQRWWRCSLASTSGGDSTHISSRSSTVK